MTTEVVTVYIMRYLHQMCSFQTVRLVTNLIGNHGRLLSRNRWAGSFPKALYKIFVIKAWREFSQNADLKFTAFLMLKNDRL